MSSKKKNKRLKKKVVLFLIIILLVILCGIGISIIINNSNDKKTSNNDKTTTTKVTVPPEKNLKIVDLNSDSRTYALMINNHGTARNYQSGLQEAIIVYEIIVEGGLTRYMGIYRDSNLSRIGSIRSARHYFLDYALENDSIYVHYGWSPQAQNDIKSLKVNNINGLYDSSFWRDKSLGIATEHTVQTSFQKLNEMATQKKYRTTSNSLLLNYSIDEVNLNEMENAKVANNVSIKYSNSVTNTYKYDQNTKTYLRSVNGKVHKDYVTGKQYSFKNIITYQVSNSTIPGDNKGRQNLSNIGKGNGYYISNGYAVPITWEKTSRTSKTIYRYMNGEEINVNDGNTFIQIQPKNQELVIN